jgi:hypothetical protein
MFGSFPDDLLNQFKHDYAERMEQSFADKESMECNKPRTTGPGDDKSHQVKWCGKGAPEGGKLIKFGSKGVKGSPKKEGESEANKARREAWKARHRENIDKGPSSAAWWASKYKWAEDSSEGEVY